MDTYSLLREIADSYVLAILFAVFAGVGFWAFRPGSRPIHDDAAQVVFRHDAPAEGKPVTPAEPASVPKEACANACPDCTCAPLDFLKDHRDV